MMSFLRVTIASAISIVCFSSGAFEVVSTELTTKDKNEHYLKVLRIPDSTSKVVKYIFYNCVDSEANSTSYECYPVGNPNGYTTQELASRLSLSGYSAKESSSTGRSKSSFSFQAAQTESITSAQKLLSFMVNGAKLSMVTSSNPEQTFENQNQMHPLGVTSDSAFTFMQYSAQEGQKLQNIDLLSENILIKTSYKMPQLLGGLNYLLKKKY